MQNGGERGLIAIVQHLLSTVGYDIGEVDGRFGTKTSAALSAFCRDRNLGDCGAGLRDAPFERLLMETSATAPLPLRSLP
jgi:peptidoglycan hydrolase-like protein with peptidoglycan-binding domain